MPAVEPSLQLDSVAGRGAVDVLAGAVYVQVMADKSGGLTESDSVVAALPEIEIVPGIVNGAPLLVKLAMNAKEDVGFAASLIVLLLLRRLLFGTRPRIVVQHVPAAPSRGRGGRT